MPKKTPEELLKIAAQAAEHAYAPYSKFKVGAALLTKKGYVFQGCNVESVSYGLTICAERTAVCAAIGTNIAPGSHERWSDAQGVGAAAPAFPVSAHRRSSC